MLKILLVNPPIYDFAAFDFWVKPYGLLSVAGLLRGKVEFTLFDYLDRLHPVSRASSPRLRGQAYPATYSELKNDRWGRGRFYIEKIPNPDCLEDIPRHFRRFGLPRNIFQEFLEKYKPCDFVFVNTVMTYWYPGVREVIEDVRRFMPAAKIVLGGNYVTLCKAHAEKLGADLLIEGNNLSPLWDFVGLEPDFNQPGLWELYPRLSTGVLKLSDGCPFQCTYCLVPKIYGKFKPRPLDKSLAELELLVKLGATNIAFYDDALLFNATEVLVPFLNEVVSRASSPRLCGQDGRDTREVNFHSPNAINARFVTKEIAGLMVRSGFKTFYLGFESVSRQWQQLTGSKVYSEELAEAVSNLKSAGADPKEITAYQILGHPKTDIADLEESMRFVNSLGIRGMLADFSPVPGTSDGEFCRKWIDLDEPLLHNKTAFPIIMWGFDQTNRLKDLQRQLNRAV